MPTFTVLPRLLGAAVAALTLAATALALPAPALAAEPLPLVVTPSPVGFPATTVNEQSSVEIDVFNEGEEASIEKIAIEGGDASEFGIQGNSCGFLPEGGHCTVTIKFAPAGSGEKHSTAWIRFSGGRAEESFELEGTGVPPHLSFSPPSFDFGLREVHSGSSETSFTVENDGEAATRVSSFSLEGDTNDFGIGNNDCGGRLLQPGETCFINVSFFPNDVGALAVTLRVNADGAPFAAAVSGESARPEVEVTPNPVDLGQATVGLSGAARTVTLTNVGRLPAGFFIAVVSGGDPASFQLLEEDCTGAELQTGDSCALKVRFTPIGVGPKAARLSMFGNGEGGTQIPLLGEGVAPAVSLTPSSFDFGSQAVGGKSDAHAFAVRNEGSDPLRLDAASIVGSDLDQFALAGDTCTGATLGAGAQCLVKVRFAPDASGAKAATLRVSGDAGALTASLSGNGTEAPSPPAAVDLHWREFSPRLHDGGALRAGSAKCSSAKRCKVTLTAKLRVVRHPRRRPTETRVANLPRTQLRIGPGKSKKLDVRLPASARDLLRHGRATLALKASWTANERAGRDSHTSKVH